MTFHKDKVTYYLNSSTLWSRLPLAETKDPLGVFALLSKSFVASIRLTARRKGIGWQITLINWRISEARNSNAKRISLTSTFYIHGLHGGAKAFHNKVWYINHICIAADSHALHGNMYCQPCRWADESQVMSGYLDLSISLAVPQPNRFPTTWTSGPSTELCPEGKKVSESILPDSSSTTFTLNSKQFDLFDLRYIKRTSKHANYESDTQRNHEI